MRSTPNNMNRAATKKDSLLKRVVYTHDRPSNPIALCSLADFTPLGKVFVQAYLGEKFGIGLT